MEFRFNSFHNHYFFLALGLYLCYTRTSCSHMHTKRQHRHIATYKVPATPNVYSRSVGQFAIRSSFQLRSPDDITWRLQLTIGAMTAPEISEPACEYTI